MKRYPLLYKLAVALGVKNGLTGFYFIPLRINGTTWDFRYSVDRKEGVVELRFSNAERPSIERRLSLSANGEFLHGSSRQTTSSKRPGSSRIPADELFAAQAEKDLVSLAMCSPENKACRKLRKRGMLPEDRALCA